MNSTIKSETVNIKAIKNKSSTVITCPVMFRGDKSPQSRGTVLDKSSVCSQSAWQLEGCRNSFPFCSERC